MYYLVNVDRNSMAGSVSHQKGLWEVSRSAVHPVQWMGLMTCGMAVRRVGMLGVGVREMETVIVQMETVTVFGKGRQNVTCCMF